MNRGSGRALTATMHRSTARVDRKEDIREFLAEAYGGWRPTGRSPRHLARTAETNS